jgi:hypothetical protein
VRNKGLWIGLALGAPVMAFGLGGLLENSRATRPGTWLRYLIELLTLHDGILVPATIAAGFLLARVVPNPVRPPLQAGAIVSGTVTLASIPVLGGYGRLANNPSILPLDYGRNLAIVVGAVWAVALLAAARAWRANRTAY